MDQKTRPRLLEFEGVRNFEENLTNVAKFPEKSNHSFFAKFPYYFLENMITRKEEGG